MPTGTRCSNCTLLELKGPPGRPSGRPRPGSNCTLLELKAQTIFSRREIYTGSNCTLLELKEERGQRVSGAGDVLIVPYWN